MNAFRNLVKQLSAIWSQAGPAQRAALAAAGALLGAAIVGVGVWSARPQYITLQSGLSPSEAGAIASRLEAQGIKYRLSFSGSVVQVSKNQYKNARIAASDLIEPSKADLDPIEGSVLADPRLHQERLKERMEQALANTIQQFRGVNSATVHIGQPKRSPFINQQEDVTASVLLDLKPNGEFSARQANAVVMTVARAVEGLTPENVQVSDTVGRTWSRDSGVGADIAGQLEYQERVEDNLGNNAELMLSQVLGFGRAIVRVTADIDFNSAIRKTTVLDPDSKIRTSEVIMSEERTGTSTIGGGVVGAAPNVGTEVNATQGNNGDFSKEHSTSAYAFGKSDDTVTEAAGNIKRLTVAAVVDLSQLKELEGAPEITEDQLEGIIKQAVGFDASRQDEIELLLSPLATAPSGEPAAPIAPWSQYEVLVRNASLGVGGLAALTLGFLILKKVQPAAPNAKNTSLDPKRARALAGMSDAVRRNPEQLKDALRAWLMEEEELRDIENARESREERAEVAEAA